MKDVSTIQLIYSEGFLACANGDTFEKSWPKSESKKAVLDSIPISKLEEFISKNNDDGCNQDIYIILRDLQELIDEAKSCIKT